MITLLRVLVVEDDPPDAERMVEVLKGAGYDPQWLRVETAEAFTAALERSPWDVILADYALPHFSGMAALKLLQAARLHIPFLIVSGAIGEEMAVILTRAGADGFVSKARLNRLAHVVERALREARQRQSKRGAEKEIEVLASRWRLLLEHALDGIAVHQVIRDARGDLADFRYVEWNGAAERISGLPREKILGQRGLEVFPCIATNGLLACYAGVMASGESKLIEQFTAGEQPLPKILDISCFRLDADHFVTLFRDVTERQRGEERLRHYAAEVALANRELERANIELESRNRGLEEFTHAASHDLQEPLRRIVCFGDLLARDLGENLDSRCRQYLTSMQNASRRLQTLIRDLLVMSRADRGPLHLERQPVEPCVRAALERLASRLQETGAEVSLEPLPTLTFDAARICQLYQNLIGNALKFSRKDASPQIRITCAESAEVPVLGVADNGIGIEPEYHEKIFEAFQRLHPWDEYEGSGIGLAVCRKVVARHGGRIWVESEPGKGAHFRFVLKELNLSTEPRP